MPKPRKRKRRKIIIALLLLSAIAVWAGFKMFGKQDETIVVQTEKVGTRDLTETVVASGRIQPVTQVVISPEVAGEIIELPVVEGQRVKKGELLLQIKPDNYEAAKKSAEANYKFAQGSKDQAAAELEKAEDDFRRNQQLFEGKLLTANLFMQFKTSLAVSKLRLANSIHYADQAKYALARAVD